MALTLKHQTTEQWLARFRARYARATGEEAAALAARLTKLLAANDVTDTQVRNAFGKTVSEWAQLKSRLKEKSDNLAAVKAARGE